MNRTEAAAETTTRSGCCEPAGNNSWFDEGTGRSIADVSRNRLSHTGFGVLSTRALGRGEPALGSPGKRRAIEDAEHEDLGVIQGAALTPVALIIGFRFSMAVGRYDQRKDYEESEANAIGTEYFRAGLLPEAGGRYRARATAAEELAGAAVAFYTTPDPDQLEQVNASTDRLEKDLWAAVQGPAELQPTPLTALAFSGLNDGLNSQGYTQAAWWNRIQDAGWVLMIVIGISCNGLIGYNARQAVASRKRFFFLPIIMAVLFFLVGDLDSPRGGLIHVVPQNLLALLHARTAQWIAPKQHKPVPGRVACVGNSPAKTFRVEC